MLKALFRSAAVNIKRFIAIWLFILLANQLLLFGACFAPHCLAAALPHTLAFAVMINFFGFKRDESTRDSPARSNDIGKRPSVELNKPLKLSTSAAPQHGKFRARHVALLALISIGVILALLFFAPSTPPQKFDTVAVSSLPPLGNDEHDREVPDERAPPAEVLMNGLVSTDAMSNQTPIKQSLKERRSVPYYNVDPRSGIFCEDADGDYINELPGINGNGNFYCPCSTDLGCVMNNPHIEEVVDEVDEERARAVTSKAPIGASCANAVQWYDARQYIGQTLVVVGPLIKTTRRADVQGRPTWMEIGAAYPHPQRLTLVFWEDSAKEFPALTPDQPTGKLMCVVGKITDYNGSAQIKLQRERQVVVAN